LLQAFAASGGRAPHTLAVDGMGRAVDRTTVRLGKAAGRLNHCR